MIIYRLISPSNKSYIGLTVGSLDERFSQHIGLWQRLKKRNESYTGTTPLLFYAFDKYGPENFQKEILFETDNLEILKEKEIEYIQEYDTTKQGYNVLLGGQAGWAGLNLSEEHKQKQSISRKEWYNTPDGIAWRKQLSEKFKENNPSKKGREAWNKGKSGYLSEETRYKMGSGLRGKKLPPFSEEHRRKIAIANSISQKELWKDPEYRERQLQSRKGRKQTDYQKQRARECRQGTYEITFPDGHTKIIINLSDFCRKNNICSGNILSKSGSKKFKAKRIDKK